MKFDILTSEDIAVQEDWKAERGVGRPVASSPNMQGFDYAAPFLRYQPQMRGDGSCGLYGNGDGDGTGGGYGQDTLCVNGDGYSAREADASGGGTGGGIPLYSGFRSDR